MIVVSVLTFIIIILETKQIKMASIDYPLIYIHVLGQWRAFM